MKEKTYVLMFFEVQQNWSDRLGGGGGGGGGGGVVSRIWAFTFLRHSNVYLLTWAILWLCPSGEIAHKRESSNGNPNLSVHSLLYNVVTLSSFNLRENWLLYWTYGGCPMEPHPITVASTFAPINSVYKLTVLICCDKSTLAFN